MRIFAVGARGRRGRLNEETSAGRAPYIESLRPWLDLDLRNRVQWSSGWSRAQNGKPCRRRCEWRARTPGPTTPRERVAERGERCAPRGSPGEGELVVRRGWVGGKSGGG